MVPAPLQGRPLSIRLRLEDRGPRRQPKKARRQHPPLAVHNDEGRPYPLVPLGPISEDAPDAGMGGAAYGCVEEDSGPLRVQGFRVGNRLLFTDHSPIFLTMEVQGNNSLACSDVEGGGRLERGGRTGGEGSTLSENEFPFARGLRFGQVTQQSVDDVFQSDELKEDVASLLTSGLTEESYLRVIYK